jgi:hypothetical protein
MATFALLLSTQAPLEFQPVPRGLHHPRTMDVGEVWPEACLIRNNDDHDSLTPRGAHL